MRLFILIFSSLFIFSSSNSFSQSDLTFGSTGVVHPDTLYIGDPINFSFWIVNQSNIVFTDSVDVLCETYEEISGNPISNVQMGTYISQTGTILPGDSMFISIDATVSFSSFALGDNIVVIWPMSISPGVVVDTSFTSIHIKPNPNSYHVLFNDELNIFPNPMSDFLRINLASEAYTSLSIIDLFGNVVREYRFVKEQVIRRDDLAPGIYILEFSINGYTITKKIVII